MSSKLDYLQKYLSKGESLDGDNGSKRKKMKKKKLKTSSSRKGGNLAILDDDVDWRALVPKEEAECSAGEDDPEDKPIVAEVRYLLLPCILLTALICTVPAQDSGTDIIFCTYMYIMYMYLYMDLYTCTCTVHVFYSCRYTMSQW